MSKAAQRKLAERQKRWKKSGGMTRSQAIRALDLMGDVMFERDQRAYWAFQARAAKPDPEPVDWAHIRTWLIETDPFLAMLDSATGQSLAVDEDVELPYPMPGVLIRGQHSSVGDLSGDHVRPLDVASIMEPFRDGPKEWLLKNFDELARPEDDVLVWAFGLTLPQYPLGVWIVSRLGTCVARLRLDGEWLTMPASRLLDKVAEEARDAQVVEAQALRAEGFEPVSEAERFVRMLVGSFRHVEDVEDELMTDADEVRDELAWSREADQERELNHKEALAQVRQLQDQLKKTRATCQRLEADLAASRRTTPEPAAVAPLVRDLADRMSVFA